MQKKIAEVVGVSESQLEFVSNAPSGNGIDKMWKCNYSI